MRARACVRLPVLPCLLVICMASLPPPPPHDLSGVHALVEHVLECYRIPGLSLSVVTRDSVILQRGYGWADVEARRDVDAGTLFPVASLTKAFTTTLLAILLEENSHRYSWDTTVRDILGDDFQMYDDLLTSQVTLRDLVAHKTGVQEYFLPILAGRPLNSTLADTVRIVRHHKPIYKFRTHFLYNNVMYGVVGRVAEVLGGGAPWEQLMRERLLQPIGMSNATFAQHMSLTQWDALATPYVLHEGDVTPLDKVLIRQTNGIGPAGSIIATAGDMALWLQFLLRGGVTSSGQRLLSEDALNRLYQEEVARPAPMSERDLHRPEYPIGHVHIAYDLGWMTNQYRGFKCFWHSGSISTFKTQAWLYPDLDLGLHAALNGPPSPGTTWALTLLLMHVSDVMLRQEPWLNASSICSFPEPWHRKQEEEQPETHTTPLRSDTPPGALDYYTGVYSHPGFGEIVISSNDTYKYLQMRMGEFLTATLHYTAETDEFITQLTGYFWYMTSTRIPLRFLPDKRNNLQLHLPVNPPYDTSERIMFFRDGEYYEVKPTYSVNISNSSSKLRSWPISAGLILFGSFILLRLVKQ